MASVGLQLVGLTVTVHLCLLLLMVQVCELSKYLIPVVCSLRITEVLFNCLIIRQQSPLTIFVDLPPIGHSPLSSALLWQQISSLTSSPPFQKKMHIVNNNQFEPVFLTHPAVYQISCVGSTSWLWMSGSLTPSLPFLLQLLTSVAC